MDFRYYRGSIQGESVRHHEGPRVAPVGLSEMVAAGVSRCCCVSCSCSSLCWDPVFSVSHCQKTQVGDSTAAWSFREAMGNFVTARHCWF